MGDNMKFLGLFCLIIFLSQNAISFDLSNSPTLHRFDDSKLEELQYYLTEHCYPPILEEDISDFLEKELAWKNKQSVTFNQKDYVLFTLASLEDELFEHFFTSGNRPSLRIELFRESPQEILNSLFKDPTSLEHQAAKLSQYGTQNVPAFISDKLVDVKASSANSALSSVMGETGVIFEAFRPSTYTNDLIVAHEGFHSAMRRLIFINRQNRLSHLLGYSLGNGEEYDPWIQHYAESSENLAAPQLENLGIDSRFTQDHHGVIMAVIHHNIFQKAQTGEVLPESLEDFVTLYPFNYLAGELSLTDSETLNRLQDLHHRNDEYVNTDETLARTIDYLSSHLLYY